MDNLTVCWLSSGVSSFVAGYLARDIVDQYLYIDISDQHSDSLRFISDCEFFLGKKVIILRSSLYDSVDSVCRSFGFLASAYGTKCTDCLKRRVRKQWEFLHRDFHISYIWGFDCTEVHRKERLLDSMPFFSHSFPLIDHCLTKQDCHGVCRSLGLRRPLMYDLGYSNNNCIGCLKGGAGYWNKIRVDFPDIFLSRSRLERDIGHSILHSASGSLFLDELDPSAGRMSDFIFDDCSIFCQLAI